MLKRAFDEGTHCVSCVHGLLRGCCGRISHLSWRRNSWMCPACVLPALPHVPVKHCVSCVDVSSAEWNAGVPMKKQCEHRGAAREAGVQLPALPPFAMPASPFRYPSPASVSAPCQSTTFAPQVQCNPAGMLPSAAPVVSPALAFGFPVLTAQSWVCQQPHAPFTHGILVAPGVEDVDCDTGANDERSDSDCEDMRVNHYFGQSDVY